MTGVFDMTTHGLFIDGTETDAAGGAESSIRDPATGGEIARVARAVAADVDRAVTVAHERFQEGVWRRPRGGGRRAAPRGTPALTPRAPEPLARLESQNAGKPISAA